MKPVWAVGVLGLLAAGVGLAAPVPPDNRKPATVPAGRYVLGGGGEPARGEDVIELMKPFRLKPGQYVLSGGPSPTDLIVVDDDLEVLQGDQVLFVDDDNVRSTENRGKRAAGYQGFPLILVLDPAKKVRVRATDHNPVSAVISPVWAHRWDGARKKLVAGRTEDSAQILPAVFVDEEAWLTDGFEMPEKVSHDDAADLPANPSSLLPRFKNGR